MHLEAPAGVSTFADVTIVDRFPEGFLRSGDPLVLPDPVASEFWVWNPLATQEDRDPQDPLHEIVGDRVHVDLRVDDLPLGTVLWACLTSVDWRGASLGFDPQVVELGALSSADELARVEFRLEPFGALMGTVLVSAPDAGPDETDPGVALESRDLEARLRGGGPQAELTRGIRYQFWPLPPGRHELDVIAHAESGVHRRTFAATAIDGRTVELPAWRIGAPSAELELRALDETGAGLRGYWDVELRGYPRVTFQTDEDESAVLVGDWHDGERIHFRPRDADVFEPASISMDEICTRRVTLVCRRRRARLVSFVARAVAPDGSPTYEVACAHARRDARSAWEPVVLGTHTGGCVTIASSFFEPGRHEVLAWLGERGLSYYGPLECPPDATTRLTIELPFEDPRTSVRGRLRVTVVGVEADTHVRVWLCPRGVPATLPWYADENLLRLDSGPFELRGIPPGIDLDLAFLDDEARELARRGLRLERHETLELGAVTVELR